MKQFIKKVIKNGIVTGQRIMWMLLDTGWIRVHLINGESFWMFRFLSMTVLRKRVPAVGNNIRGTDLPVLYLQINREASYTLDCIQMWLYIVKQLGAEYYFLCDNFRLAHRVLKTCRFPDANIRFIRSKNLSVRKKAERLCSQGAMMLTEAQMTPFYHAKEHGISCFWKIDADDTMFLTAPEKIAAAMREVEAKAKTEGKAAVSYDMWFSHMAGRHWSFGVTFISGSEDFTNIFRRLKDNSWMREMSEYTDWYNLDWFFTFLMQKREIPMGVFYIDDCMFIHWGDNLRNPYNSWISEFSNGKLRYPILEYIYGKPEIGVKEIRPESWGICVGTSLEEGKRFLWNEICQMRKQPPKILKSLGNTPEDFSGNKYITF